MPKLRNLGGLIILASTIAAQSVAAQQVSELTRLTAQAAGPDASECPQNAAGRIAPGLAEACLVQAFRSKASAYWIAHETSSLAPVAFAVAVSKSGEVTFFTRERAADGISKYRCVQPTIVWEFGRERLRCRESYRPPPGASSTPFGSGGDLKAPQPKSRVSIANALCGTGRAGENVQVEFIVSADGAVDDVEILNAPRPCDAQAVEAALKRLSFTAAKVDGNPVAARWFTIVSLRKE